MKTNYRKAHLVFKESYRKPRVKSLKESYDRDDLEFDTSEEAEEYAKEHNIENYDVRWSQANSCWTLFIDESLKEEDEKVQDEPTKSFKDDVKEAMKTLESIDPKVFYTALGIYEWTDERDPDEDTCHRVYEFLDGVDTVYDESVREEVQDIVNPKDFPTEDDDDEMEFFTDEEEE